MSREGIQSPTAGRTTFWIVLTGASQGIKFLISVTSTIILARLLVPADFGLIATSAPIMGFIDLLRDAGFSQALIQRKDVSEGQGHALFWVMMAVTASLGLMVVLVSPLLAAFFNEPRLSGVLISSAVIMQISSFSAQPLAWLNRNLRFKAISVIEISSASMTLATATLIAVFIHSYWALVAGSVAQAGTTALLALWISGWRPGRPSFDRDVLHMLRFGAGVSFSNFMIYLSRNMDNILIARQFGPVQLGFYDRAYKLMLMPLTQITWPISRVLVPILSRLQGDFDAYRKTFLSTITVMMTFAQPGMIVAMVLGKPIIVLLLGVKWLPSASIFQWLCAAAIHQIVTSSAGWLYLSQGRARDYALAMGLGSVVSVTAFLIGMNWGAVGIAAAYTISDYVVRLPLTWLLVGRRGPVRTWDIICALFPHAMACSVVILITLLIDHLFAITGLKGIGIALIEAYSINSIILLFFSTKRSILIQGIAMLSSRLTAQYRPNIGH